MRYWLYKALCSVVLEHTYSNLYLKKHLHQVDLKDRALCTRIFYGTLQNYWYCQAMWQQFALKKVDKRIAILLTMSVYQIKFLDKVPNYAICNDAVAIAKKIKASSSGFVNAILHKVCKNELVLPSDEIKALALQTSIPEWLVKMWSIQYGMKQTKTIAEASNQILPVYVRRNQTKIDEITFLLDPCFKKVEDSDLYIYKGDDFSNHPYYNSGYMSAQDEGSYLIAKALKVKSGMQVLDVCAAPGTKSFALAEMMQNQGSITSLDIHPSRVELIKQDRQRLSLDIVHPSCEDATKIKHLGFYDRILCDVPCSGYGVLARKPDIKLHMQPSDMDSLILLQQEILQQASMHIKENGIIVYSTCTINKKENEKQIELFIKKNEEFEVLEMKTLFPTTLKDGFFYATLQKKAME